ncbi:expressed unknown protein [Seminavis robusta]|uniref:Uncharacterized protein n=1 Tax=Seminavis robusta TaxID=568900 RepID=A0A9N8EJZ0_9STRA|nr:expressed unknown protein [Seminavis robusta]|eukprot:Sro1082_g239250.1 n/a (415) ;mRNA; r:34996-36240
MRRPVVTLLSPSPSASRRAQEILGSVFGLEQAEDDAFSASTGQEQQDDLNDRFASSLGSAVSMQWDSVVSECPTSGTLLHWLAVDNDNKKEIQGGSFSLLGITTSTTSTTTNTTTNNTCSKITDNHPISSETRSIINSHLPSQLMPLRLRHLFNRQITSEALLSRHQGLPILELDSHSSGSPSASASTSTTDSNYLKEVAFTMYDDATYEDGSSVLDKLANLHRPVTGVYQFPTHSQALCMRPLPAAKQDLRGPPLVLTFHCQDVQEQIVHVQNSHNDNHNNSFNVQWAKIGFRGHMSGGQLRFLATSKENSHFPLLSGLDIRWCDATNQSSVFHEAQEALLASSLPELQSTNVLKGTGKQQAGAEDQRIGSSDCWVEVRTMVQNPRGFMANANNTGSGSGKPKVATAPPSYPE